MTIIVHLIGDVTIRVQHVPAAAYQGSHFVIVAPERHMYFERSKILYVDMIQDDDDDDDSDSDEPENVDPDIPQVTTIPVTDLIGPTGDLRLTPLAL